ncbi:MAG TPA: M3 family metallopeptidase, partial [Candidatus Babeliales bacterium]|nr:M3 family metallopeptidase [Candidatus Babeliales bacterium]
TENLTAEELYFIDETLQGFRRSGLHLDNASFQRVQTLMKELTNLALEFQRNINTDQSQLLFDESELAGVPATVITNLERTANQQLIVKTDYPTITGILEFCENAETRHKVSQMFNQRAYPQNTAALTALINKRDELAQLLGFPSYAALDLDDQMAKQLDVVEQFIDQLQAKALPKAQTELQQLLAAYPDPQSLLNAQGQIYPWNLGFLKNYYKKHQLNLDMRIVAEYFPMAQTLQQLLKIYEQFLGLRFAQQKIDLWVPDLELLTVYRDTQLLGYIILDLHPRANKFNHAASFSVVHTVLAPAGATLAVDVIMTNFPQAAADQPALLNFNDVVTFFHEFGHALHTVLGATKIA